MIDFTKILKENNELKEENRQTKRELKQRRVSQKQLIALVEYIEKQGR